VFVVCQSPGGMQLLQGSSGKMFYAAAIQTDVDEESLVWCGGCMSSTCVAAGRSGSWLQGSDAEKRQGRQGGVRGTGRPHEREPDPATDASKSKDHEGHGKKSAASARDRARAAPLVSPARQQMMQAQHFVPAAQQVW